ncbi:MAG: hypothetical protein KDK97_07640 [Verrucomicrobiales bacterium]|nr:hypothetical protein [Verrucomicrobiales bacterium]MCP5556350.1 hypothetical protein [Verrucomicrobiaceae bacterium]
MKTHPQVTARRIPRGFTLTETVMSIGIISSAAMAVLSLLAMSLQSSQDSRLKGRAMIIAQDIVHDLSIGRLITPAKADDERRTRPLHPAVGPAIPQMVLLYDLGGNPLAQNMQPSASNSPSVYASGASDAQAGWLVSIDGIDETTLAISSGPAQVASITKLEDAKPLGGSLYAFANTEGAPSPDMPPPTMRTTRVRLKIESPASAPAGQRRIYRYDTFWTP